MIHPDTSVSWSSGATGYGVVATTRIARSTLVWVFDRLDAVVLRDDVLCLGSSAFTFDDPRCRGRVSGDDWRRPDLWARHEGGFSPSYRRVDAVSGIHSSRVLSTRAGRVQTLESTLRT